MEVVLTIDTILQLVMSGGSGVLGVGVAFAMLRMRVGGNSKAIKVLRSDVDQITGKPAGLPVFVRRDECETQTTQMTKELSIVSTKVDGLQRYARHQLTKDGLSLSEVNEILGEH